MEKTTVGIIIQARSTSKRFPRKVFARIGKKEILQHVSDSCLNAANYINKMSHDHGISCSVCIAIPFEDEIIRKYTAYHLVEGPEDDVLARYVIAADKMKCDYIVRITSDCPFIPSYVISKCIRIAVSNRLDYLTNADPKFRTSPDGHDVQVVSKKMLLWLNQNVKEIEHREHVLSFLDLSFPDWATRAFIIGQADYSELKFSIDTEADLEKMTKMYEKLYSAVSSAGKCFRL